MTSLLLDRGVVPEQSTLTYAKRLMEWVSANERNDLKIILNSLQVAWEAGQQS